MRIASILVIAVVIHTQGFAQAQAPTQQRPATQPARKPVTQRPTSPVNGMTNADVIKMVTAGFSEDLVIKAIRSAVKRNFDLSVDALLALKNAKVSEPVITTMMNPTLDAPPSVRAGPEPRVTTVAELPAPARKPIAIADGTEIKLRLPKPLTSATAKVDDRLEFEAVTDLVVDGVLVAQKGATAVGTVTVAESKKSFGRQGKLDFSIDYLKAVNGQNIRLRTTKGTKAGENSKSGMRSILMPIGSLMKGNDVEVAAGTEYSTYVDGDRSITFDDSRATDAKNAPTTVSSPPLSPSAKPVAPDAAVEAPRREVSNQKAERPEPAGTPSTQRSEPGSPKPETGTATTTSRPALTRQDRNKIEKDLQGMYEMSKIGALSFSVTKIGGVYAVAVDGVQGEVMIQSGMAPTYVVDGKIRTSTDGGAGKFLSSVLSGKTREDARALKKGERVYVTGFNAGSDGMAVDIMTVETFPIIDQGRTRQVAYKARLLFTSAVRAAMATGFPAVSDAAEMKKIIDRFIVSEAEASAPKNIELGQTIDQIEQILGKPISIVKLGARTIYTYKDMKIVFTDGKVSDVQ